MIEPAKKYQDALPRIKKNIEYSREYFADNYKRYHESRKFIFKTSMTDEEMAVLSHTKKPQIEFNIQEAYISRQRGEFSKQEPSIIVSDSDDTPGSIDVKTIDVVDGYLRHMLFEANTVKGCAYQTYTEMLSGGFSVWKLWTEYSNNMSFNQVIKFDRVYDPTLTGFDPIAREPTKADGAFCYELFPKTKDDVLRMYKGVNLRDVRFSASLDGFSWSYKTNKEEIVLVADYYEKKDKEVRIVKLANNRILTKQKYMEEMEKWQASSHIAQPAAIVDERTTTITTICRYRIIENMVLEYAETDFEMLPLIFVDGNSVLIRNSMNGAVEQVVRAYTYHMKGTQKLKNFAGQSLAAELQNTVQTKWIVAKESIPPQYIDSYTDIQIPQVMVYNHLYNNQTDVVLPPPIPVTRTQIPPEITNTFMLCDQLSQVILGSYDASLGINDNQLSGVAVVEAATQSNAAAMPYVVGFLHALTHLANMLVNLLPKYIVTPRTVPILTKEGRRESVRVNDGQNTPSLIYDPNSLNVRVEAGANFSVQKTKALQAVTSLMQASPLFAEFINTIGLEVLLDNLEIRGIDRLKDLAQQFMQQKQQQQQMQMQQQQQQMQMAQQAAQQPNPMMLRAQTEQLKFQNDLQTAQQEYALKTATLGVQQQQADTDRIKTLLEAHQAHEDNLVEMEKQDTERTRTAVNMAIDLSQHSHSKTMDIADHHLKIADVLAKHSAPPKE